MLRVWRNHDLLNPECVVFVRRARKSENGR
jgi:hypothetical protein